MKAGSDSSSASGSAIQVWMPKSRWPDRLRSSEVRSECTMPRPARIQFTAPGAMAMSVPSESRCRISPSKR